MKKIGNTEVLITSEILARLRDRCGEYDQFGSYEKLAKAIQADFPTMSVSTISGYLSMVRKASPLALKYALDGKISFSVFSEIAQGALDPASQDIVVMYCVTKMAHKPCGRLEKAGPSNVSHVKRILMRGYGSRKGKGKVALSDALAIAWGEVPAHAKPEDVRKSTKDFGGILEKLNDVSNEFMARLEEAMELTPESVLDTEENHMDLFHKMTTFANTLENAHRFVVERKRRFMAAYKRHVVTEAAMDMRRKEGGPCGQEQGRRAADPGEQG